jgi:antitoxin (DNA-binding transcriptional repressor) of toxin-antitoxin stability system
MSAVTLQEAQARLSDLIAGLSPGEQIQIVDHEVPVARLVREAPSQRQPRHPGSAVGKLVILNEDEEHLRDFADYMP